MIHSSQVRRQYLKHMDGVRAAMNYSGAVLASTTSHSQPAEAAALRFSLRASTC